MSAYGFRCEPLTGGLAMSWKRVSAVFAIDPLGPSLFVPIYDEGEGSHSKGEGENSSEEEQDNVLCFVVDKKVSPQETRRRIASRRRFRHLIRCV